MSHVHAGRAGSEPALAPDLQLRSGVEWWMWVLGVVIVLGAAWIVAGAVGFRRNLRGDE